MKPLRISQVICYPSWRPNYYMWVFGECDGLRDHVESSHKYSSSKSSNMRSDRFELVCNLNAQFSRGRHDAAEEGLRVLKQLLDDWDCEGSRLA
mmetsp:Transcript_34608/g.25772  ORF Transcript_34608/g.25772 Transcript_34608/m.25772 type:complete len:94 (-) Transcript_34608:280-561(-)